MKWLRAALPFVISLALLTIILKLAPWEQVFDTLGEVNFSSLVLLFCLSLCYYLAKISRFWYMLRVLKVPLRFVETGKLYLAAQPVSLLPGGEIYRSRIIKLYENVEMERTLPTFATQGLLEGLALATVALLASLTLGIGRFAALMLLVVALVGIGGVRRGYLKNVIGWFNRIPMINLSAQRLQRFSSSSQNLLIGRVLSGLFGLSLLAEIIGVAIVYTSVHGVGGHLTVAQAALLYVIPIIVGFISFLPGGFGASEQVAIGTLLVMGEGAAVAVAATLLMRFWIVISGLLYGLVAFVWLVLTSKRLRV
jgi:uncharacterized membrane protein YbhN (UPF0104 family)